MSTSKVYYQLVDNQSQWNSTAKQVFERITQELKLKFTGEIPLKVHTGEPGNITFIQPKHFNGIVDTLIQQKATPIFMETNMANGARTYGHKHRQIAQKHGFTRIPFIVADGDRGDDHTIVPIKNGKHFTECKIATKLYQYDQVIILSHFKGHSMTGFGGAIKMLGIGFASARGKTDAHAKQAIPDNELINWDKAVPDGNWQAENIAWNEDYVYHGVDFIERMVEYALAAKKPGHIHLVYATNLVRDCDCDGEVMTPLYKDLGIFASQDPVAIDKAILDLLDQREGKTTYKGREVFAYAQQLGLGNSEYELIQL